MGEGGGGERLLSEREREGEKERERERERGGERERLLSEREGEKENLSEEEKEKPGDRERTQYSVFYYIRIKILGSCLFVQSVSANLHANRLHIKQ